MWNCVLRRSLLSSMFVSCLCSSYIPHMLCLLARNACQIQSGCRCTVQVKTCWCTKALAGYLRWVRDFFPLRTHRALEQMEGLSARGPLHWFCLQFSNGDDCACGLGRMTLCLFPVQGINRPRSAFVLVKPRSIDGIVWRTETENMEVLFNLHPRQSQNKKPMICF